MATVKRLPARKNLRPYKGDSYSLTINLSGLDGYTDTAEWLAQIREAPGGDTIYTTFTAEVSDSGAILSLSPAQTAALPAAGAYDVQVTLDDGLVITLVAGSISAREGTSE